MIEMEDGRVMLVGGCRVDGSPSGRSFMGQLIEDETDVSWKEVSSLKHPRLEHVAFKMNNNVYVAGGIGSSDRTFSCCERYNLKENKWCMTSYKLPYPLNGASAVVCINQNVALIIGGRNNNKVVSDKVVVFTEGNGFSQLDSFLLKSTRHGHVSIITK